MRTRESLIQADTLQMRFNRLLSEMKTEKKVVTTAYLDEKDLTVLIAVLTDYCITETDYD